MNWIVLMIYIIEFEWIDEDELSETLSAQNQAPSIIVCLMQFFKEAIQTWP
jgi:hypothetical protein